LSKLSQTTENGTGSTTASQQLNHSFVTAWPQILQQPKIGKKVNFSKPQKMLQGWPHHS